MIDFNYLEGKDGEMVVKVLATVDSHATGSLRMCLKVSAVGKICYFLTID